MPTKIIITLKGIVIHAEMLDTQCVKSIANTLPI